jgi:hypothetical protein
LTRVKRSTRVKKKKEKISTRVKRSLLLKKYDLKPEDAYTNIGAYKEAKLQYNNRKKQKQKK